MSTNVDLSVSPISNRVSRSTRRPSALIISSTLVALFTLLPVIFMVLQAVSVGWGTLEPVLISGFTLQLLWNTLSLTAVVTVLCAVIGTGAAWCTERTDLPYRKVIAVLLVLPVAIPDFVIAYGWVSIAPWMNGFLGAVPIMTLGLYPLVYLPVAASLRAGDAVQEEIAKSLGSHPIMTFFRITVRQARTAVLGGCILVSLAILAEYGAFELIRYQTFTTAIFSEFQIDFNAPAASALSMVLVLISAVFLAAELRFRGKGRTSRVGMNAGRPIGRHHLGHWVLPTIGGIAVLLGLAIGVPIGTVVYWMIQGGATTVPASASLVSATLVTVGLSAAAAVLATALALPIALVSSRHASPYTVGLERSSMVLQALPGLVVALALVYCATRYLDAIYQTSALLIAAYTMLFFPLALVATRASIARAPVGLEQIGATLGKQSLTIRLRITLPLILPGLAAAFCLVFLSAVTELTATLILIPTGVQTLATQFWQYTSNVSFGAAAPYAGVMIAIALIPGYLVGRWFNRLTVQEA